jgi:hypothetical protein
MLIAVAKLSPCAASFVSTATGAGLFVTTGATTTGGAFVTTTGAGLGLTTGSVTEQPQSTTDMSHIRVNFI